MGAGSPGSLGGKNPGAPRRNGNTPDEENDIVLSNDQLRQNVDKMKRQYPLTSGGYFGKDGKNCRIITTDTPISTSEDFANKIAKGFTRNPIGNKGWVAEADDGTIITYRVITSTTGSPAVDINIKNVKNPSVKGQKIHFTTEGDWKKNEHRK